MLTTKEIVKRIFTELNPDILNELSQSLILRVTSDISSVAFTENYPKTIIRVLFICAVCMLEKPEELIIVRKAVIEGMYASFKAQILLANTFRSNYGAI